LSKVAKKQKVNPWHLLIGLLVATFNSSQARVNGELGAVLDNAIVAALVSFGSGLTILFIGLALIKPARKAYFGVPKLIRTQKLHWWQIIGGTAGALFVIGQGFVVPVVGVAIFVISVVAGQTCASLLVDKYGLGPAGPKPVTILRVFSAGLAVVGVVIAVLGRAHTGTFNLPMVIYMFTVGALTSAQHAMNGRVAQETKQPWATTTLNFTVGMTVLLILFLLYNLITDVAIPIPPAPWEQPLLWTGGAIGIVFIVSAVVLVRTLGILIFALVSVVGQLLGAVLLDIFFPTPGNTVTFQVLLGIAITVVAVIIASLQSNVTSAQEKNEVFVPEADPASVTTD
jgi:transporter family-2 protein